MIPVSLKLKNFLSYGEDSPTLDFTNFKVACVTGRNGHGKSALFDAITWAIWGEARKASSDRKPDEGLLRIGATDLLVEFVFDLDGQRFRIRRSYRKTTKSGSSALELQILDPAENRFRALSESSSIRKTQGRINDLIRVSYDTFINSAFILQGRVDAFTRRSPSERKTILSEILELSRYDALGIRARDYAQRSETEGACAHHLMTRIEAASVQLQELLKQLVDATRALQEAEKISKSAEDDLDKCNRALVNAEAGQTQCRALTTERKSLLLKLEEARTELASANSMAALAEQALTSKDRILSDLEILGKLRKKEVKLRDKRTELQELELSQTRLQADLEASRLKVITRSEYWTAVVTDLRKQITQCDGQLAKRSEIREALVELTELRERDQALVTLRRKRDEVENSRRDLERTFDRQRGEIQVDIETQKAKRRELLIMFDRRTELERAFNEAKQHLDTFEALTEEMDLVKREGIETRQSEERLKERREGLDQRRKQLITQIAQLRDRESPDCPLCGSDLNDQHRKEVIDKLTDETKQLGCEFETVDKSLLDTRTRRDACRVAYQKLRDQVHPLGDAPRLFARAESELAQTSNVYQDLESLVGSIQKLEDQAKSYETSSEVALRLKQLLKQIQELTAESDQHEDVRRRIKSIAPAELENTRLDEIQQQLEKAKKRLPEAEEKQAKAGELLEKKLYAQDVQESLNDVSSKLKAIGYDAASHTALGDQIQQLSESENALANLQRSEQNLAVSHAKIE
ncbi:MAG: SMC family ATPase, partial [Candidatus Latescibacterota bacterium]|nr:SMC family ATPase [Candidatus Latescibacterota bacterium]